VAGNFHRNKFSGSTTKRFICLASACAGVPFPALLEGVNDAPECQSAEAFVSKVKAMSALPEPKNEMTKSAPLVDLRIGQIDSPRAPRAE